MHLLRLLAAMAVLLSSGWADEGHDHKMTEEEVGSVKFATSCSPSVAASFNHAVALLHSFQYEKARQGFEQISEQDPDCAMAEWGVAMSHYHGLWDNGDAAAGRTALSKAQAIASRNPKTTSREKQYIDALGEIYRNDGQDSAARALALERKMGQLQANYPQDTEAAIFHALALDIMAPKTDRTFQNQRRCGEILEPIFKNQPHHPGVAHYLIHCYDNPVLAEKGLRAARIYAKIAPASAHANHMPSHIFTRVGSWDESIASNLRSEELAASDEAGSKNGEARDQRLHAMDYLEYAYLQSGRMQQAKAVVDRMNSLVPISGLSLTGDYALAAIPARRVVEGGDWKQASELEARTEGVPWAQAITWMAVGVGSARSGNLVRASEAAEQLRSLRDTTRKLNNAYWSDQIEVERLEVAGWTAHAQGKDKSAIKALRSAAELEESMDKHAVTPGAVTPAREMLAALLLLDKRSQESLAEYQSVLKLAPNRFNALYGAATAAERAGETKLAKEFLRKLTDIAAGEERPELITARKKLGLVAASN
jgi:tetratricopeptide (TPR) repeat protein